MKKLYQILLVICLLLITPITSWADEITVTVTPTQDSENNEIDLPSKGHRMPSSPVICNINPETSNITFSKDISDVSSYELWDETGATCISSFNDAASCCEYLFSIPGEFQIRFVTEDAVYIGYLSTL